MGVMRIAGYSIVVSDGEDHVAYYVDDADKAELLYAMAVKSGMFTRVVKTAISEKHMLQKEWRSEK